MDSQKLILPGSIVLAGAMVGAGLYFGLREARTGEGPAAAPAAVPPERGTPSSPARALPPTPAQGAPVPLPPEDALPMRPPSDPIAPEVRNAATEQASAALAAHRQRLIRDCWEPNAKQAGAPAKMVVLLRLNFDAQGKELGRVFADAREPGGEEVIACLRATKFPTSIQPPGVPIAVQLTLTLP